MDLTAYTTKGEGDAAIDLADVSAMGNTAHAYLPGLKDGALIFEGLFDTTVSEAALSALLGTQNTVASYYPGGDAIGNSGIAVTSTMNEYKEMSSTSDAVRLSASFKTNNANSYVKSLVAKSTITASGTSTSLDGVAASAIGASSYLHVFSGTGSGTVTVKVQHATTANGSYTDLITHTAVVYNAGASERVVLATGTTVNQFTHSSYTFNGSGTVVMQHGFHRH